MLRDFIIIETKLHNEKQIEFIFKTQLNYILLIYIKNQFKKKQVMYKR